MRKSMIAAAALIAAFVGGSFGIDTARAAPALAGGAAPIQLLGELKDAQITEVRRGRRGFRHRGFRHRGFRHRGYSHRRFYGPRRSYRYGYYRPRVVCRTQYGFYGPRRVCFRR